MSKTNRQRRAYKRRIMSVNWTQYHKYEMGTNNTFLGIHAGGQLLMSGGHNVFVGGKSGLNKF